MKVIYGSANNKVDFLHVDNFIQAHIRAAVGLSQSITQMVSYIRQTIFDKVSLIHSQVKRILFQMAIPLTTLSFFVHW